MLWHHLYLRSFVVATSVLCTNVPKLSRFCPAPARLPLICPRVPALPTRARSLHINQPSLLTSPLSFKFTLAQQATVVCVPLQLNSIGLKIATGDIVNIHLVESISRHMSIEENQGESVERHDGNVVKSRGHRIHEKG